MTGLGGDVLFIEASAVEGSAGLTLTGQLGDVMKESAQIAWAYVRAHADLLGITDRAIFDRHIHIHVPAGAVPKDGPSAGVTMVTALTSMALGRPVRSDVGMTGEVTLNGRVLPIGGAKQKLLAAQRAGLTTVFLPKRNEPDLDEVPADVAGGGRGRAQHRCGRAGHRGDRAGRRGNGDAGRLSAGRLRRNCRQPAGSLDGSLQAVGSFVRRTRYRSGSEFGSALVSGGAGSDTCSAISCSAGGGALSAS